jgi:hypothetical protein
MPHYHFDLVDSKIIADEGGAEAYDDIGALAIAEEIVRRLRLEHPGLSNGHYAILVSNEDGEEVGRVRIDVIH